MSAPLHLTTKNYEISKEALFNCLTAKEWIGWKLAANKSEQFGKNIRSFQKCYYYRIGLNVEHLGLEP